MNLLEETKQAIANSGHKIGDIVFIGSEGSGHECSWEQFKKLADFEYDDGFGAPHIALDLVIVFEDGQKMWRHDYDGSENWEFSSPFKRPATKLPIKSLGGNGTMWDTLKDIQEKL